MPIGVPPGTIRAHPDAPPSIIHVMAYGPDDCTEARIDDVNLLREYLGQHAVTWVNVDGLGDADAIHKIGEIFHLHPLALEDVTNVHQRAKVDDFGGHAFVVLRMAPLPGESDTEQASLFLGPGFVLTFQERSGDCLDPVRERIRRKRGRVRESGADYLFYSLIDAIVDNYFPILERSGERLEALDEEIITRPRPDALGRLHRAKRDLLALRRALWPLRDALNTLVRDESALIARETRLYIRDCYDHTVRLIDLLEHDREWCTDLMEVYLSSLSNRMNEVIRILTIISTIFIPLTFIAGIYGMNFRRSPEAPLNMPELDWSLGYPASLLLMAIVAGGMLVFFRRKGWLGAPALEQSPPPVDRPASAGVPSAAPTPPRPGA